MLDARAGHAARLRRQQWRPGDGRRAAVHVHQRVRRAAVTRGDGDGEPQGHRELEEIHRVGHAGERVHARRGRDVRVPIPSAARGGESAPAIVVY